MMFPDIEDVLNTFNSTIDAFNESIINIIFHVSRIF